MVSYAFLSTWILRCPRRQAWEVLADCEAWPRWWRGVEQVEELAPGDQHRRGSAYHVSWRAPGLAYRVSFDFHVDEVDEPAHMSGTARGAFHGTGTWRLFEQDGLSAVTFDWQVGLARGWMSALAPLGSPLFERSHDELMRRGGHGLARFMGVQLLAAG